MAAHLPGWWPTCPLDQFPRSVAHLLDCLAVVCLGRLVVGSPARIDRDLQSRGYTALPPVLVDRGTRGAGGGAGRVGD